MRNMNRRRFMAAGLGTSLTAATAGRTAANGESTDERQNRHGVWREPARDVPLAGETDVVVCGGGPAGMGAAISAARAGASVQLIESNGCLGGIWTAGLVSYIIGARRESGLVGEIWRRMAEQYDSRLPHFNPEDMKVLLEEMCEEAGVSFQLHTRLVTAATENGRLRYAVTESKSGRQAWGGKIFIDTTGDGDLGAFAGNGYDFAHEGTGLFQPSSLNCLVTGLDSDEVAGIDRWAMQKELERAGMAPSYGVLGASLFYVGAGLYFLQATHQYGYRMFDNAREQTRATVKGRAENHRMVRALRKLGGKWRNIVMVATAEQIGNREGRRLRGLATVTRKDIMEGREQPDPAVSGVTYGMNIHPVTLQGNPPEIEAMRTSVEPYDIPFRALVAKDVGGLLMAGRCISGDFFAHGSYRVTGYIVPMGETAGVAAALAAQSGTPPKDLAWEDIAEVRREVRDVPLTQG